MKGYARARIIELGIDLDQFDALDWHYDPVMDVVIVRPGSRIAVFLALATTESWTRENYYN